jgi:pyruvate/2-oxoglutarate dehydrogenase complex dihydrolipoamide dehydrogenase (E3) component
MKYDYDVLTIGLGPAGMAVSGMASEMGLKVCAVERRWIGGECQNVGCIPSKSLLRMAKTRHMVTKFPRMELGESELPPVKKPFARIHDYIQHIRDHKTIGMFKKVHLVLGEGEAEFIDPHTVHVGGKPYRARHIFICTGTRPAAPPIPGLAEVAYLTNENIFELEDVPESLTIIGGGAIGCEMAQAFTRLGCKTTIVHMDPHLIPVGDPEAGQLIEEQFKTEGIGVFNQRMISKVERQNGAVALYTDKDEKVVSDRLLVAAGRMLDVSALKLEKAGVETTQRGIEVDKYLRSTQKSIFACGDCNGHFLLTHAAMHQGMIALMNAMLPRPLKMDFRKFVVPWTVFTEPQVSYVGMREQDLKAKKIKYETLHVRYEDYGAAIAEAVDVGFVKVFASKTGRIHGVSIVGEGSGEMINEWALAIQKKVRLHEMMMLQHSFPSMGFLTKRSADTWMMNRMKSSFARSLSKMLFRI